MFDEQALYREYTDTTFSELKNVPEYDAHKGLLGPVLRAEVGDTITVVFKNNLDFKASVHPHGVLYPKNAEGAKYHDKSDPKYDKADDKVEPGVVYTYTWLVPERAGPPPDSKANSVVWAYHSHVDEVADTYAGLVGPIVVTRRGEAMPDGRPRGVNREFFAFFQIFDENKGRLFGANLAKYLPGVDTAKLTGVATDDTSTGMAMPGMPMGTMNMGMDGDGDGMSMMMDNDDDTPMSLHNHDYRPPTAEQAEFYESNRMHSINGYVHCNGPTLEMQYGDTVRWYLLALGNMVDLHTAQWDVIPTTICSGLPL